MSLVLTEKGFPQKKSWHKVKLFNYNESKKIGIQIFLSSKLFLFRLLWFFSLCLCLDITFSNPVYFLFVSSEL